MSDQKTENVLTNSRADPTREGKQLIPHLEHVREYIWSDKSWTLIVASCLPAMNLRGDYYTVRFKVSGNDDRDILYAHCKCQSGRGQPKPTSDSWADCKHAAALYFYIKNSQTYSQTDHQLKWKAPSQKKLELYPHGKTFETLYKSRGTKRNYLVKDDVAINKIKRLMEECYTDLDQRGLYKMITASQTRLPDSIPNELPELPTIHEAIKEMILKPLPYTVPAEIYTAMEILESSPKVASHKLVNILLVFNTSIEFLKRFVFLVHDFLNYVFMLNLAYLKVS